MVQIVFWIFSCQHFTILLLQLELFLVWAFLDAITGDIFNYNVAFVLENIKATEQALRSETGSIDEINNWDFSSFDWSIDGKGMSTDLSQSYQEQILDGLQGNPVKHLVQDKYNVILKAAVGNLGCAQTKSQSVQLWSCPNQLSISWGSETISARNLIAAVMSS